MAAPLRLLFPSSLSLLPPGQAGDQPLLQREERQGAGAGGRAAPRGVPPRLPPLPRQ